MTTVALIGNPNSGKSTLFNALTGARQFVGNWPGVTVEQMQGQFTEANQTIDVIDLPGIYSLSPKEATHDAIDECITCDFIQQHQANVMVNVVDASHLDRHLFLTLQLLAQGVPVIVALNMMDVARVQNIQIDTAALSRALGCPVVAIEAYNGKGLAALKSVLISQMIPSTPRSIQETEHYYQQVDEIINRCVMRHATNQASWTTRIDRVVLNRFLGIPVFLAMMYALFALAIIVGGYFQTYFDLVSEAIFVDGVSHVLQQLHAPIWLIGLLAEGVGKGLNTVISFIPVLGVMYLLLSVLEDSGYMARAAFVIDRGMRALGLPGKAFVPMIIGFGCNVPAVMAARTLERRRDRILTIMMSPFMSCSARLAIFAVFTAAFFPHGGQNIVFMLYLLGIAMAMVTGFILQRTLLKGQASPLIMELPLYHLPNVWHLLKNAGVRLQGFVFRAGKLIVPICALMGVMTIGMSGEHSMVASVGHALTPIFSPMGIDAANWQATVGLITGVLAKEVVIGTLNTLYAQVGQSDLYGMLVQHFHVQAAAIAYLIFVLLYFPCVSTMAVMWRELNKQWVILSAVWMMGVAYGMAVLFYQVATWSSHPVASFMWVTGILIAFMLTLWGVKFLAEQKGNGLFRRYLSLNGVEPSCADSCTGCPSKRELS